MGGESLHPLPERRIPSPAGKRRRWPLVSRGESDKAEITTTLDISLFIQRMFSQPASMVYTPEPIDRMIFSKMVCPRSPS